MKILSNIAVTGANGFIGKALCDTLISKGYKVRAIVRSSRPIRSSNNYEDYVIGNINSNTNWAQTFEKIDCIVHCASMAHNFSSITKSKEVYMDNNAGGTRKLINEAIKAGVKRIIYISSIKVNGEENLNDAPFSSDDPQHPEDLYAISKLEAARYLIDATSKKKIESVIIRPPLVYGPNVKGNLLKLLHIIYAGYPMPFAKLNNLRSMIALDNLVDLIICCVNSPSARNQIFLASDGEDISTLQLINLISKQMNKKVILFAFPISLLRLIAFILGKSNEIKKIAGSLRVDSSHARDILEWKPPITMKEGLKNMVDWYLREKNSKNDN